MPKFNDIPKFTKPSAYRINVGWDYLETWISDAEDKTIKSAKLDLNPDFQRDYVWTEDQKVRYVEFILKGGQTGRDLYFNCVGWMSDYKGPFVIVDGKQRLDAVRGFLADKVLAFGHKFSEYTDKLSLTGPGFIVNINDLKTRKEVLQWYIDLNTGGTIHTQDEINKVKTLISLTNNK